MVMENKRVVMTVISFAAIIAGILLVNRWITGQMEHISSTIPVERSTAAPLAEQSQQTAKGLRPVIIDPANDPLAPVIPRKQPKSSAKEAVLRPTSPQKIYEPTMDTVILTQ